MIEKTYKTLEYQKIKDKLKEFTLSELGNKLVDKLQPSTNLKAIQTSLELTTEAKNILNRSSHLPLHGLHDIEDLLLKIQKGGILYPNDLAKVSSFLRGCSKMKKFMINQEYVAPNLSSYRYNISEFPEIEGEIEASIEGSKVSSKASSQLAKIRRKIKITEEQIEQKIQNMLHSSKYKTYIQDFFVSKRNDRYVIPVKSSYKNQIDGVIVDASATGSTVFIEPSSITKLSNELSILKSQEEAEEYQILASISGYIGLHLKEIKINLEVMGEYDFVFAKGRYSNSIDGIEANVNTNDFIKIVKGKHPLLGKEAVPLDFGIGENYRTLVITGPNTGGKTVALKTIGLLTLMVQSGMHIPAKEGTEIAIYERIFVDIGDNQSIEQSLSTFSGHMKNIIQIMNKARFSTLIILDEVGTGTDPSEGAALAAAILDDMYRCGAVTVATTHYGEIKDFADQHEGFENACMEFDSETLKPLYKLSIGKAGKSNALWISEKLGMKPKVLDRARKYIQNRDGSSDSKISFEIENCNLKLQKKKKKTSQIMQKPKTSDYRKGDTVIIGNNNEKGVVYEPEDDNGYVTVLVKNEFIKVKNKRLRLHLKREKLYPEGYDFDIIFLPYKKRKLKHDMNRGSVKNVDEYRERIEEIENN